ncbi:MAG: sulfite exporter TauE/SafE family protein [Ignavibacteriaceae bacterium]|nr:sulfite exporter TauE/SafE family protein [Ignavibacteriaceae bacterium]
MSQEITLLTITAATLGFVHTILGPDHYIPFIAMAKAKDWSVRKTALITSACGVGHVLSSVIIGLIGIGFGVAVSELELIESTRGEIAGWLLIGFGLAYLIWGIKRAIKHKPHSHIHMHENGTMHSHEHAHQKEHAHPHKEEKKSITPWVLFTIFIFGPCEALIPILMYPAATKSVSGLILVTSVFGITTILTMLSIVIISLRGINLFNVGKLEKYTHALAGGMILICGIAINFLGL